MYRCTETIDTELRWWFYQMYLSVDCTGLSYSSSTKIEKSEYSWLIVFFITKIYFFGSKVVGKTVHIKSRFIDYFSKTEHLHIFGKTPDFFNPSLPSPGVAAAALILEQRRRGWRSQFNYISTMVHSMEDLDHILLAPSGALVVIMVYYVHTYPATHFFKFFKFFRF